MEEVYTKWRRLRRMMRHETNPPVSSYLHNGWSTGGGGGGGMCMGVGRERERERGTDIFVAKATFTRVQATMPGRPLWNSLASMGCGVGC